MHAETERKRAAKATEPDDMQHTPLGIRRLEEPAPTQVNVTDAHPMDHHDPDAPMFGLSPEDQAIEDRRKQKEGKARHAHAPSPRKPRAPSKRRR